MYEYNKEKNFDYEYSIIHFYISDNKLKGLLHSINYLNNPDCISFQNVFDNIEFYVQPLNYLEIYNYPFTRKGPYNPSSPSLTKINDKCSRII